MHLVREPAVLALQEQQQHQVTFITFLALCTGCCGPQQPQQPHHARTTPISSGLSAVPGIRSGLWQATWPMRACSISNVAALSALWGYALPGTGQCDNHHVAAVHCAVQGPRAGQPGCRFDDPGGKHAVRTRITETLTSHDHHNTSMAQSCCQMQGCLHLHMHWKRICRY